VQVMNVLDVPQASGTLEQFAMADTGFLEGIPGGMFDWGKFRLFTSSHLVARYVLTFGLACRTMGCIFLSL
jgi:hypothetical protein